MRVSQYVTRWARLISFVHLERECCVVRTFVRDLCAYSQYKVDVCAGRGNTPDFLPITTITFVHRKSSFLKHVTYKWRSFVSQITAVWRDTVAK